MHARRTAGFISLIAAVSAIGSSALAAAAALVPFQGKGFTIDLPGTPRHSVLHLGKLTLEVDLVVSGTKAVGISYGDVPAGATIDLKGAIAGTATATKGKVRHSVNTTYQGFPARDAQIAGDARHKVTVFVRVIDTGTRFYEVQYIVRGSHRTTPPAAVATILGSLKIA